MKRFKWLLILGLASGLTAALVAQTADMPMGKVRIDLPALAVHASSVNDVTLDGAVLKIGLAFLNNDSTSLSPQDQQMLSKLQGIYIKNYEFHGAAAPKLDDSVLAPIEAQLKGPGWTRIVSAHSGTTHHPDDETDQIYICTGRDGAIKGLAILSRQSDEVDVVNVVGSIEPADLARLGGHLGIPKLDLHAK